MLAGVSAVAVAVVIAGVVIGVGVAVGMAVSGSEAANATKYAADRAAEAQKYSSEQQRMASDHEADLLFKTEQADRSLDEKYHKEDVASEKEMMSMFNLIDETDSEAGRQVDRMGSSQGPTGGGDEYGYPEPCGGDDMIFS
jgi:hypothetical protein